MYSKKSSVNFLTFVGYRCKIWFNPKPDKGVVRRRHPISLSPTKKSVSISVGPNRPKEGGKEMAKETSLKSWVGISLFLLMMVSTAGAATTSLDANYAATSLVINSSDIFITNGYDVNIGTGGITINGGILDANSGVGGDSLIRVEGNWSNSGTFAGGSSTVDFDGAGLQLITPGTGEPNYIFNNITISGPNVTIGGFVQLSGNFVFKKTSSTFSTGGHDVNIAGDWNNNGIFNHDGGTVTFDGPSLQLIITGGTDPNKAFNNVRVTGAGVELELFGQTLAGDFGFESTGSSRTNSQDVNVAGSLVILSGTLDANDSNISVGGDWTNSGTFSPGTSTVRFTGDSNSTIAGTTATTFHNLELKKVDVNDRLFITTDGCGSSNNTLVNSGTLDFSNADVTFSCVNDIEFSGLGLSGSIKLDIADMVVVSGDFVFESDSTEDITGGTIKIGGSLSVYPGADFTPTGGVVVFDGASNQTINSSGTFYGLTIDKSGGSLEITDGTTVTVDGAFNITGSTSTITGTSTAGYDLTLNGDINVPGANINYANPVEIGGSGSATFNNVSFGNFIDSPGSKFLYITRISLTETFDGCSFGPGPNGTDRYNVHVDAAGTTVEFTNSSGAGWGEDNDWDNDDDPYTQGRIIWVYSSYRWIGAVSSSWGEPNNWSPAGTPNSVTDVCIPGGTPFTPSLDVTGYCADVNILAGGTLNGGSGNTLNVSGDWTNSGTFSGGTGTVKFTGGSNSTITGTNATTFHNLVLEKNDVNDRLFITTDGCGSSNNTLVNSGTLDFSNADVTFSCANDLEFSGLGLSGSVKLDIGDMVLVSGDFSFENPSTEDIAGGIIRLAGSFSASSGADFSPIGGTVEFDGGSGAKIAGEAPTTFHNLTIGKTDANVTLSLPLAVGNNLTINTGTLDANDHDITVRGNWTNNDTFSAGTSTVRFTGDSNSTIAGTNPTTFYNLRIDGPSVNVAIANFVQISGDFAIEKVTDTFSTGGNEIHIGGNWTNNGTFNHDGGKVNFNGTSKVDSGGTGLGKAFYNLELDGSGLTLSGNDLDVDGNLDFNFGTLDANGSDIYVAGDWNPSERVHTFNHSGCTVTFDGSGSQTIFPGDNTFHHLRIDGAADVNVDLGGFLQLSGDFAIEKVTDTFSTGGNPIKVAGSWINNGTFNHNDAPVTLDGSGTFGPGSDPFDDLIVSSGTRSLTGSNLTVDGKLTITSTGTLQATTGGLDIYTGEGGITDVDIDGNLTLQLGAATGDINWYVRQNSVVDVDPCATVILDGLDSSNRIRLQSSTDGNEWSIVDHTVGTSTPTINNVTVKDCDASLGNTIYANDGTNENAGGNVNWLFNTTNIIYVDDDASGNNDGSSWTHAYKYLKDALADANTSGKDIWVAAGSYKPDVNTSNAPGSGDREATFAVTNGLTMCGGFPSGGGTWEDRDPNAYKAILTGDLDGNDIGQPNHPTRGENSYHVVTCANSITLDGFEITGGNANGSGFNLHGGGIFCPNAPALKPNIIVNNTITGNAAGTDSMEGYGSGVSILDSRTHLFLNGIEDCFSISGRGTVVTGRVRRTQPVRIKNNTITGNSGGAGPFYGGGIAVFNNSSSQITIRSNIISNNQADYGGGIYCEDFPSSPSPIIIDNIISGNFASYGGGIYGVYSDSPGIHLVNCIIWGNEAYYDGGGVFAEPNATFNAINCQFLGNTATNGNGGGVAVDPNGSFTSTNCVFTGNSAATGDGGGFYADSNATFIATNCTFAGNSAANFGGGGRHLLGNPIYNCIFWQNIDVTGSGESAQISGAAPVVSHSCIQGWTGGGPGNISTDPFLADIPDQVQLLANSPCIDAGDNSLVPEDCMDLDNDGDTFEPTSFDIAMRSRFVDSLDRDVSNVDMGAHEFCLNYCGDYDSDRFVDFLDFNKLAGAWSTQEGDPKFNSAYDISIPQDNSIDMLDLDVFTDNWLATVPDRTLHFVVIVGISDYNDIPDVNFGAEDTNDWYSYFSDLGYPYIRVYGDNNAAGYPRYDGLATETNIKTELQNMVNISEANDVIAFVFSGHGYGDGIGNSSISAWDSNSGMYGEDGVLYDYELSDIFQSAQAENIFIFLDSCYAGGMGDELMAMPNAANVYATTTCDPNGCRGEEPAYSNGAWSYWFLEAGLIGQYSSDPNTTMEDCFTWADSQYNPGGDDEPAEFDGDGTDTFTLW
jgi:hypothetical protein